MAVGPGVGVDDSVAAARGVSSGSGAIVGDASDVQPTATRSPAMAKRLRYSFATGEETCIGVSIVSKGALCKPMNAHYSPAIAASTLAMISSALASVIHVVQTCLFCLRYLMATSSQSASFANRH